MKRSRLRTLTWATGIAVLAATLALAGCDRESRAAKPIEHAPVVRQGDRSPIRWGTAHRQVPPEVLGRVARQTAGALAPIAPSDWPSGTSWRPLRNFGPFYAGSHLGHVQVVLHGGTSSNFATFAYNDFLTASPDQSIYQKYYGSPLPSSGPPAADPAPGAFPSNDGFLNVLLSLSRIRYTSRFGGSVELLFVSSEDYQGEARSAGTRWDVGALELSVYVTPVKSLFNPLSTGLFGLASRVHVELTALDPVAYTSPSALAPLVRNPGDDGAALNNLLLQAARQLETGGASLQFRRDADRLTHAYVHTQFQQFLGPTEVVDTIWISDDFLDLATRVAEGVALLEFRVVDVNLNTEPGEEEIHFTVALQHMFEPGSVGPEDPVVSHTFREIGNREGTPFATVGAFTFPECDRLLASIMAISVIETDGVTQDDRYQSIVRSLEALDCGVLRQRFNAGQFGIVAELPVEDEVLLQDDEVKGTFSHVTRIGLTRR